jgi:septum formation protein
MLILASQSLRRAELLRNAAIEFRVQPANIPEERREGEKPIDYVCRLAREKAQTVLKHLDNDSVALGADTIVLLEDVVMEKPTSAADAAAMLLMLAGRTHQVMTGVCLAGNSFVDVGAEVTEVSFSPVSDIEIADYVRTGEPMDKAGAYAIQGIASRWIAGLNGCYFNVVGLPVPLVYRMLRARKLL